MLVLEPNEPHHSRSLQGGHAHINTEEARILSLGMALTLARGAKNNMRISALLVQGSYSTKKMSGSLGLGWNSVARECCRWCQRRRRQQCRYNSGRHLPQRMQRRPAHYQASLTWIENHLIRHMLPSVTDCTHGLTHFIAKDFEGCAAQRTRRASSQGHNLPAIKPAV